MPDNRRLDIVKYISAGSVLIVAISSLTVFAIDYGVAQGETRKQIATQQERIDEIRKANASRDRETSKNTKAIGIIQNDLKHMRNDIKYIRDNLPKK
jgi:septal ring factor EnvC (AmiA/AmiB activator)